jgi:acetyltransferase-like isoleucine patch superfamily enzyme
MALRYLSRFLQNPYHVAAAVLWPLIRPILRTQFHHFGKSTIAFPTRLSGMRYISIGDGTSIDYYCEIYAQPADPGIGRPIITIGNGCQINGFNRIGALHHVEIQDYVLLASHIYIGDTTHAFADPDVPILAQGNVYRGPVILETGCWIGDGVKILGGVTIGRNSVVGANSVVTESIPPHSVAAGAPARVIRSLRKSGNTPGTGAPADTKPAARTR